MAPRSPVPTLSLLLLSVIAGVAQQCYFPNGTAVGGLRICSPQAEFSACCASGDECTTSGFCKAGSDSDNNWLWRETCTDKTWQSDLCPRYCFNSSTSANAANINHIVLACSADTYCCAYDTETYPSTSYSFDCCNDPSRVFGAGAANHLAGPVISTALFVGYTSLSFPATTSPTSALGSSESTTSTSSTSTSSNTDLAGTSSPPSSPATANAKTGLSTGAQAGIGVGSAIGGIALVGIGFLLGLRTRRQRPLAGASGLEDQRMDKRPWPPEGQRRNPEVPRSNSAGISEAGWQQPPEADSRARVELEGSLMGQDARGAPYPHGTKQ